MYAIEIDGLNKSYGSNIVLKNLNLRLEKKSVLNITGASGCGKTTLLRCICGFEQFEQGSIKIFDSIVQNNSTHIPANKRSISLVFQNLALWPHITIYQKVDYASKSFIKNKCKRRDWNETILEKMGIEHKRNEFPGDLSGGEQQRVAIARALAHKSKILLLDEPFNNLNEELQQRILSVLKEWIKKYGTTIVLVSHQLNQLKNFATEWKTLDNGVFI
ncbi:ATP-binding cassette domain-containing protein [candidate division KSB1 bacterium]|nr:ATP-binding cassette domain-containing protein [candidate division KSB1 bacterium]